MGGAAISGFNRILMCGASDAVYAKFVSFVGKLLAKAAASVGWEKRETDKHLDGLLREEIIGLMATYSKDDATVVAEARRRFDFHGWRQCSPAR